MSNFLHSYPSTFGLKAVFIMSTKLMKYKERKKCLSDSIVSQITVDNYTSAVTCFCLRASNYFLYNVILGKSTYKGVLCIM